MHNRKRHDKAWRKSVEGKAYNRIAHAKYRRSIKGKRVIAAYNKSKSRQEARDKYLKSDKGRATCLRSWKKFQTSKRGKWCQYASGAKVRGIAFTLSFNQFTSFWQKPCHYCGNPIPTIGLDRVDNRKGYALHNVVPCCIICNKGKQTLSVQEYVAHCVKVVHWFKLRKRR